MHDAAQEAAVAEAGDAVGSCGMGACMRGAAPAACGRVAQPASGVVGSTAARAATATSQARRRRACRPGAAQVRGGMHAGSRRLCAHERRRIT
jgi:hypothetical protein